MPRKKKEEPIPVWGWWTIGGFIATILVVFMIASGVDKQLMRGISTVFQWITWIGIALGLIGLYLLPSITGMQSPRRAAIAVANITLGWTVIGWIIVLIWALAESGSMNKKPTQ